MTDERIRSLKKRLYAALQHSPQDGEETCPRCAEIAENINVSAKPYAYARAVARAALMATPPAEEKEAFERSLLRADIKAGNADAAQAQLQRIKRIEAEAPPAEKEGT